MPATVQPETKSPSRRALLAGALGGIGAWAASAIGRATPVHAEGEIIHVGDEWTTATSLTKVQNNANGTDVFQATSSSSGRGVIGTSSLSSGVQGSSTSSNGVVGTSGFSVGVYAISSATAKPAAIGRSDGNSTGLQGVSGSSVPVAPAKTGVFGYATQDANSVGVRGESTSGFGIYGKTTGTGFAGYFNGKTFMSQFVEIAEMTTPAAPGGKRARLFVRDNGAGKTQLCVRFPTGAVKILATEP